MASRQQAVRCESRDNSDSATSARVVAPLVRSRAHAAAAAHTRSSCVRRRRPHPRPPRVLRPHHQSARCHYSRDTMSTSFLGSQITLVSQSDIRYVGILHEIDSEKSTVTLKDGERRRADDPHPLYVTRARSRCQV